MNSFITEKQPMDVNEFAKNMLDRNYLLDSAASSLVKVSPFALNSLFDCYFVFAAHRSPVQWKWTLMNRMESH